ncbi:MAG: glycoside-pentoside-hexuronide (GPH):cation symporter [Eubacteriales bacterium]|nr:glycoside-pentoside-hexuronide (GPH):cation symporter [Eubacteriales bacterium]
MEKARSKWSYAIGCTGRDLGYVLVTLFFITYIQYTNLVNTSQFLVLTGIFVLCRVWDAINDPMMGTIIANSKSRFGKYRPWILAGCLVNSVVLVLMFTVRVEVGDRIDSLGWWNVAILGTLYLLWGMSYTVNDVSYWSLLPVLSEDKKDRDRLTTMVTVFASLGAFTSGGLVPIVTTGNMVLGYRLVSIIFALVFVLCQLLVFFFTHDNPEGRFLLPKEAVEKQKKEKTIGLKDMAKILMRNHQLLVMALIVLLYTTASSFLNIFGQNFFYFKYGYDGSRIFLFTVIYAVSTILSQGIYPLLAARFQRMEIMKISTMAISAGYLLFFLFANLPLTPVLSFPLLCLSGVCVFGGQGVFYMAMLIMLTNTIEYDEWKYKERNEAIIFSVRPFMVKLSGAVQSLMLSAVLVSCGLYGIIHKVGAVETEIAKGQILQASAVEQITSLLQEAGSGQMLALTLCMTLIPMALIVISYFVMKKKYIISEELYAQMIEEIRAR